MLNLQASPYVRHYIRRANYWPSHGRRNRIWLWNLWFATCEWPCRIQSRRNQGRNRKNVWRSSNPVISRAIFTSPGCRRWLAWEKRLGFWLSFFVSSVAWHGFVILNRSQIEEQIIARFAHVTIALSLLVTHVLLLSRSSRFYLSKYDSIV